MVLKSLCTSDDACTFGKFYNFGNIAECQSGYGIGTAIVYGNPARFIVVQSGAREIIH